jgi:hypothetical protein
MEGTICGVRATGTGWMSTQLVTYQAQLTMAASLARVRDATGAIERIGGRVEILPTRTPGVTTVRLHLAPPYTPAQFLPGLPFCLL